MMLAKLGRALGTPDRAACPRRPFAISAALLSCVLAPGAGFVLDTSITVQLEWRHTAGSAGIAARLNSGYSAKGKLDVKLRESGSRGPIRANSITADPITANLDGDAVRHRYTRAVTILAGPFHH